MNNQQWQGRVNRAQGAYFEKLIDLSLAQYARVGSAVITKTPEPMKVISRLQGGKFVACFEHKAEPDYKGCLAPYGREVVFDAKFTTSDKIEQSRITVEQAKALTAHRKLGALCFVLVGFAAEGQIQVCRISWFVWQNMADKFGRKHIKLADLEELRQKFACAMEDKLGIGYVPMVQGLPMVLDGLVGVGTLTG